MRISCNFFSKLNLTESTTYSIIELRQIIMITCSKLLFLLPIFFTHLKQSFDIANFSNVVISKIFRPEYFTPENTEKQDLFVFVPLLVNRPDNLTHWTDLLLHRCCYLHLLISMSVVCNMNLFLFGKCTIQHFQSKIDEEKIKWVMSATIVSDNVDNMREQYRFHAKKAKSYLVLTSS